MNATQLHVFRMISGRTGNIVDLHRRLAALKYAQAQGFEREARAMMLADRFEWLNWQTETQRKWQATTRRPTKARHHDSIAIRERWVRCHA